MDYFLDFLSKKVSDFRHVATFGVPSKSCEDSGILRESPGEFIVAQMFPAGSVGFLGNTTVTTVTLACAEGMNRHSQGTAFSFPECGLGYKLMILISTNTAVYQHTTNIY